MCFSFDCLSKWKQKKHPNELHGPDLRGFIDLGCFIHLFIYKWRWNFLLCRTTKEQWTEVITQRKPKAAWTAHGFGSPTNGYVWEWTFEGHCDVFSPFCQNFTIREWHYSHLPQPLITSLLSWCFFFFFLTFNLPFHFELRLSNIKNLHNVPFSNPKSQVASYITQ